MTKPDVFTSRYVCECCGRSFAFNKNRAKHCERGGCEEEKTVVSSNIRGDPNVPRRYVGGYMKEEPRIFQRLKEAGIRTSDEESHKWFACFDIECLLKDVPDQTPEAKSQRISEHECVSIAICSNVPNFMSPVCFVGSEPRDLVEEMLDYLRKIQEEVSRLMREQLSDTFSALTEKMEELREQGDDCQGVLKTHETLLNDLTSFSDTLVVLGFNSSRYDLVVLQEHLVPLLSLDSDPKAYVSKKDSGYMCIQNSFFKFLDLLSYLSPGTSLSSFIKAYRGDDESLSKSFFPYEIMKSYGDLETPGFPSYQSFFSKLKGQNCLEASRNEFEKMLVSGHTRETALKKMDLTNEPLTGREEYHLLHEIWIRENMTCLKDLLVFYNKEDVRPMVKAIENLWGFYWQMGISLFQHSMTIAGLSRYLLFKTAREEGASFSLIHHGDRRLQEDVLSPAIVGGPSLVFQRLMEVGKTPLGDAGSPVCQDIRGWDCNSMYLKCESCI